MILLVRGVDMAGAGRDGAHALDEGLELAEVGLGALEEDVGGAARLGRLWIMERVIVLRVGGVCMELVLLTMSVRGRRRCGKWLSEHTTHLLSSLELMLWILRRAEPKRHLPGAAGPSLVVLWIMSVLIEEIDDEERAGRSSEVEAVPRRDPIKSR